MSLNKISINNNTVINTGIVYDISEATGKSYTSLSNALGTNGNNVPESVRKGGMSVCFIRNVDNNYVRYELMKSVWSIIISDWRSVDYIPSYKSKNLVESGGVYLTTPTNHQISDNNTNLDISDETGNVLARFSDGHFETKYFDSKTTPSITTGTEDLDISDETGNVLARFSEGHFRTKYFDSRAGNSHFRERPLNGLVHFTV